MLIFVIYLLQNNIVSTIV